MRDSEETIERVLAGLRDVEAPRGMERRIVDALESHATGLAARSRRKWMLTASARLSMAFAGVLAVCAVIAVINLGPGLMQPKPQTHAGALSSEPSRTQVVQTAQTSSDEPSPRISVRMSAPKNRHAGVKDSYAQMEMHAKSHPAPSAPLTEEERLLLRIAHRGDPGELAMLNPQVKALRDAESEAEFLKFAGDSSNGDSE